MMIFFLPILETVLFITTSVVLKFSVLPDSHLASARPSVQSELSKVLPSWVVVTSWPTQNTYKVSVLYLRIEQLLDRVKLSFLLNELINERTYRRVTSIPILKGSLQVTVL